MPADIALTLLENADPILPGSFLAYILTVTNNGPDDATNVIVTDTLATEVSLVSSTANTVATSASQFSTQLGTIAAGTTVEYTLRMLVDATASGPLTHTAIATTDTVDSTLVNNTATETTAVATTLTTNDTGGGGSISNLQPYSTLNYAIALQGTFPSRNLSIAPLLGAVMPFAGNFAPRGWALADGQLLSIAQNTALFSILGTTYGGDGRTTFALPDLRGRVPVGAGTGPGLPPVSLGQQLGSETLTLTAANLPIHTHPLPDSVNTTGDTGGSQAIDNRQPSLGLNPVITVEGLFPSRSLSTDSYLGSIDWFAGNFAPRGTRFAHGQLLPISQFSALFSILGTTYGGDGRTTFALPDLRGRTPIHIGSGAGLDTVRLGEQGGMTTTLLTTNTLPFHSHNIPGVPNTTVGIGAGQPFANEQPYLGVNYQIALNGIFPSRSLSTNDASPTAVDHPGAIAGLVTSTGLVNEAAALAIIRELAEEGIAQWRAAGISETQAAELAAVSYTLADLELGNLAFVGVDNHITIDADASGRGWFVDATPWEHTEFGTTDPITGELYATAPAALSRFDLLTAIMHEQGHVLGLNHTETPGSLLYGALGTGGRVLPTAEDLAAGAIAVAEHDHDRPYLSASSQYIAGVGMFAGNFAVRNFAQADGQILPIASNSALFSLLGTTYGGDGRTTFRLPDLRGRSVIHPGSGPGLSNYQLGQRGGAATTTLTPTTIPPHNHSLPAADLAIARTTDTSTVIAGDILTVTLTVTNSGPNTADNVIVGNVLNPLPSGITLQSASAPIATPGGTPSFSLGDLAPGNSAGLTLTVAVDPSLTGTITHQATVASDTPDFNTANNVSTQDTDVIAGFFDYRRWLRSQNANTGVPSDTVGGLPLAQLFDETFYRRQNPDVAAVIQSGGLSSGFDHFRTSGIAEGRNPSPLFNEAFYRATNSDIADAIANGFLTSGLQHFLQIGHTEGRDPSVLFDQSEYLTNHPDVDTVVQGGGLQSAFEHYIKFGANESRLPSLALYNEAFYLANNPDVAAAVTLGSFPDGFSHFTSFGQGEQRNPSALFNQSSYLMANPDVQGAVALGAFASAFDHYEQFGRFETRPLG